MRKPAGSVSQTKKRKTSWAAGRVSGGEKLTDRSFAGRADRLPRAEPPTLPRTPVSVTTARVVAHLARLVAVLSVAVQAGMVGVQAGWVLEGRMAFSDMPGGEALRLVLSAGGALVVWWLAARVLSSTRTALNVPAGRS
jgi:hypothetical protein